MRTRNELIETAVLLLRILKSGLIARTLRYRIPTINPMQENNCLGGQLSSQ